MGVSGFFGIIDTSAAASSLFVSLYACYVNRFCFYLKTFQISNVLWISKYFCHISRLYRVIVNSSFLRFSEKQKTKREHFSLFLLHFFILFFNIHPLNISFESSLVMKSLDCRNRYTNAVLKISVYACVYIITIFCKFRILNSKNSPIIWAWSL